MLGVLVPATAWACWVCLFHATAWACWVCLFHATAWACWVLVPCNSVGMLGVLVPCNSVGMLGVLVPVLPAQVVATSPPVTSMGMLKSLRNRTASPWPFNDRLKHPSRSLARESAPATPPVLGAHPCEAQSAVSKADHSNYSEKFCWWVAKAVDALAGVSS